MDTKWLLQLQPSCQDQDGKKWARKTQATALSLFSLIKRTNAFQEHTLFSNLTFFSYWPELHDMDPPGCVTLRLSDWVIYYMGDVIPLLFCVLLLSHKTLFTVFIPRWCEKLWYALTTVCVPLCTTRYFSTSCWKAFRLCLSIDFLQKPTLRQGWESSLFGRLKGDSSKHWRRRGDVRQLRERNR